MASIPNANDTSSDPKIRRAPNSEPQTNSKGRSIADYVNRGVVAPSLPGPRSIAGKISEGIRQTQESSR